VGGGGYGSGEGGGGYGYGIGDSGGYGSGDGSGWGDEAWVRAIESADRFCAELSGPSIRDAFDPWPSP
jgi:hypothetical protein